MQAKSRRPLIGELWNSIQAWLPPVLEDELGELHEQHGGRHVHVRGPVKVAAHLAFGLVVIAAEQMLRMLG
jgi:hypothetical protein